MADDIQPAPIAAPAAPARLLPARAFSFPEKGSTILRRWNEERAIARGIARRDRRQFRSGFAGAAVDRLTASLQQWSGSINSDLDGQLVILRARARGLRANNEFARRFFEMVSANVVGPYGPALQVRARNQNGALDKPANAAIEEHWRRWGKSADVGGRMTLPHLLRVLVESVACDGECLLALRRGRGRAYGLSLQLFEADRLAEEVNEIRRDGTRIRQGVELDADGRPVAYYVKTTHPGESYQGGPVRAERIDARDILHVFVQKRPEQVRGYTWLHAVLMRLNMLHGYEEAAVVAARVGASKMGFFTKTNQAPQDVTQLSDGEDGAGEFLTDAAPGAFGVLPEGWGFEAFDPDYPHANFESFVKACLRGVASGLGVATHNLSGDMTDVNYSSARIAEMSERECWKVLQEWLIDTVLQPLYREWIGAALLAGAITFLDSGRALPLARLDKFLEVSRFQGRRWAWVDPLKEAQAAKELIDARLTSRSRIASEQGVEWEDVLEELQDEEEMIAAAKLAAPASAPKPSKPPAPAEEPEPQEPDE